MDNLQDFLDKVNQAEIFVQFKDFFADNYPKGELFAIDTSSMMNAISWDNETLFVVFANESEYLYYDVPFDIFLLGAFTEWLVEFTKENDEELLPPIKVSGWFHELIKDRWDYTRIK